MIVLFCCFKHIREKCAKYETCGGLHRFHNLYISSICSPLRKNIERTTFSIGLVQPCINIPLLFHVLNLGGGGGAIISSAFSPKFSFSKK